MNVENSGLSTGALVGIIIGVLVFIIIISIIGWYVSTMNKIKRYGLKVDESLSDIDVALTKRYDTLNKLLGACKGYTSHEKETLSMTIAMRKGMSLEEMKNANAQMNEAQSKINILAEAYPNLKADSMFVELSKSIRDIEEHLQASRRLFNANVTKYNEIIVVFPSSIIANIMHANKKSLFEAEEAKKTDVEIRF